MQYTQSDNEEKEETKFNSTGSKVKPTKKKNTNGPKMKNTTNESLKQTKLSFSSSKNCKLNNTYVNVELIGKKRSSPEEFEKNENGEIKIE